MAVLCVPLNLRFLTLPSATSGSPLAGLYRRILTVGLVSLSGAGQWLDRLESWPADKRASQLLAADKSLQRFMP